MKIITKTYLINTKTAARELTQTTITDFGRNGLVIQDSIIDVKSKQLTRSLYIYKSEKLKEIRTWLNGKQGESTLFEEDAEGNLKTIKDYDERGKLMQYYGKITLNRFGLLVSSSSFNANGKMINYFENHYKGTQLISGFTKNVKGTITYRFNTILNKAQDPSTFREFYIADNSTKSNTFNYSYNKLDSQKNWTEQICYADKKTFKINQRIILYYK